MGKVIRLTFGVAFVLTLACGTAARPEAPDPTLLRTNSGEVRGLQAGGVISFKGIPLRSPAGRPPALAGTAAGEGLAGRAAMRQVRSKLHADGRCAEVGGLPHAQRLAASRLGRSASGDGVDLWRRARAWPARRSTRPMRSRSKVWSSSA